MLKFPALPANVEQRNLPQLSKRLRIGKNAYRMVGIDWTSDDWQDDLLGILSMLALKLQH